MQPISRTLLATATGLVATASLVALTQTDDAAQIAQLDTAYQLAVERNDWRAMDAILHPDFALVLGDGQTFDRNHLLELARTRKYEFEKQVEIPGTQKVRLYGKETATVTALLWLKGKRTEKQEAFDYKVWFTDTYVRTPAGWKYAFGQASLRLPAETK
ncbi:MAG: nuclear transport factor 2 family protein [Verrucomicrobia bacterium]|nr:nuclear transport factor 2 family protein [Verrucomicrobiota bacterium]